MVTGNEIFRRLARKGGKERLLLCKTTRMSTLDCTAAFQICRPYEEGDEPPCESYHLDRKQELTNYWVDQGAGSILFPHTTKRLTRSHRCERSLRPNQFQHLPPNVMPVKLPDDHLPPAATEVATQIRRLS
jgi:hypothetical protein